ncbi:MAG: biotin/lipoyl-binding protein [Abditibacteriales bacterium]|nr:biotin/lipoyl-binding protein [Abditibacteriales bacterium]MDW8365923.1 biotin/lipoyl-containing protein [Abditibacteriales bacterium]
MNVNVEQIRELVALLRECDVRELTLRGNGRSITLRKETPAPTAPLPPAETPPDVVPSPPPIHGQPPPAPLLSLVPVNAPVVGIFHHVKGRHREQRWQVGDWVESGEVVCIVESMRIPNEVHAPVAGRIVNIQVKENEPVEYGQVLMEIDPTPQTADAALENV